MHMLSELTTENRNPKSDSLDQMSIMDVLELMNDEDRKIADAVKSELPVIEQVIQIVSESFKKGGRLFYVGAGTSGRIGILDSVECPPTFSTSHEQVQGLIAGGEKAILVAVEGIEDQQEKGEEDIKKRNLHPDDIVIGIAASGRTPYVIGALKYAQALGAKTVSLSSNKDSEISHFANIRIEVETGPEILTGSTRLKAATAHKMILNMISTVSMVKIGKVYKNYMVDVKASNFKLKERAKSIVAEVSGVPYKAAESALEKTGFQVKPAIVMLLTNANYEQADEALTKADGFVADAIQSL